jgi:hypothetical protein
MERRRVETDDTTGEDITRAWTSWKPAVVFHSSQVDGWHPPDPAPAAHEPIDTAEKLAAGWATAGMDVVEGGDRAYYNRDRDQVHIPSRAQFANIEHFYSTLAHEASHWSGHPTRLNRTKGQRFGDRAYAVEELTAELSAAVITSELGISAATRDDHAAYLAHWVQVLREDPKHLWVIASDAEQAAHYLTAVATPPAATPRDAREPAAPPEPTATAEPGVPTAVSKAQAAITRPAPVPAEPAPPEPDPDPEPEPEREPEPGPRRSGLGEPAVRPVSRAQTAITAPGAGHWPGRSEPR